MISKNNDLLNSSKNKKKAQLKNPSSTTGRTENRVCKIDKQMLPDLGRLADFVTSLHHIFVTSSMRHNIRLSR